MSPRTMLPPPRSLVRSYYQLYAYQSDVRDRMRLTTLMHRVARHRTHCDDCIRSQCQITVRRALRVEAEIESAIIDATLARGELLGDPWQAERLASIARRSAIANKLYPGP